MRFFRFCFFAIFTIGLTSLAPAQYQTYVWAKFEDAQIPSNLKFGHFANEQNVRVVDYSSVPSMPGLTGGVAELENRSRGLWFSPNTEEKHLSVLDKSYLMRSKLGPQGRALFQADFYIPPQGQPYPSMAMVAADYDPDAQSLYKFYRFGVQNDQLFFSFVNGGGAPEIYKNIKLSEMKLSRPGWHRFQIIFEGNGNIDCAVDGKPTSFSPIRETTLNSVNVGIMMTTGENAEWVGTKHGYADNLSIQWTSQAAPIPESPWLSQALGIAGRTSSAGRGANLMEVGSAVNWTGDSYAAWQQARAEGRPILALFYVPNIPPYEYLVEICPDDPTAKNFLDQFILLRIDINQLGGPRAAQNFGVLRTPTLMVVDPQGNPLSRITVVQNRTTWENIVTALQP